MTFEHTKIEETVSRLFEPLTICQLDLPNRLVVSPMCQYSAVDGMANDWHFAHLAKFALGGWGTVILEATAVSPEGRISAGDLGLWEDRQIEPLRRVTRFLKAHGTVPAIQIAHAGRKASSQRPWHGNGPLTASDGAYGDFAWPTMAPSAVPMSDGWHVPLEMTVEDIDRVCASFGEAVQRARKAGFEIVEIHAAHGYLLHQFLSPIANRRKDAFGGSIENRMRFPLKVAETVRRHWPADRPVFVRISVIDGVDQGWSLDDSVLFSEALRQLGVDLVDCSSGGIGGPVTAARLPRGLGFQVPFAAEIKRSVGLPTMAVGLIVAPEQAAQIVEEGSADLVAIGREALADPFWPRHAKGRHFDEWPPQYGWWLERRQAVLDAARSN